VFRGDNDNAIFPHYGADDRPIGCEVERAELKGFTPGGSKGAWSSHRAPGDTKLAITEAVIDAVRHHELHADDRRRYVTAGGAIGRDFIDVIRHACPSRSGAG
jgi:hypothetical protein